MISPQVMRSALAKIEEMGYPDRERLFDFKGGYATTMKEHDRIVMLTIGPSETPIAAWDIMGNEVAPEVLERKRERAEADWKRYLAG